LKQALEKLSKGSEALTDAYQGAMERIQSQGKGHSELATQVLLWITCARRPLTTLEIRHALAVEIGESHFDEDNLPGVEIIVSVCAGLVIIDKKSDIVRLVHHTTQEYFERTQREWFPNAETDIATTCITYLSSDNIATEFCQKELRERLRLYPFYRYAAQSWGYHTRAASIEEKQLILDFLESETKVSASSQAMMAFYNLGKPTRMTGVHLAAQFGLAKATAALLENRHDPDPRDCHGRTPLSLAARNGYETVVKLLLEKGAELESRDSFDQTPLFLAAKNGQETVVKLLLEKGAGLESRDSFGQTPLLLAIENGHTAVVKLLLEKGAGLESRDNSGRTPLLRAIVNGQEAIMNLLPVKGAKLRPLPSRAADCALEASLERGRR
jgi:Ankyrin repeats (3 copies)